MVLLPRDALAAPLAVRSYFYGDDMNLCGDVKPPLPASVNVYPESLRSCTRSPPPSPPFEPITVNVTGLAVGAIVAIVAGVLVAVLLACLGVAMVCGVFKAATCGCGSKA